MLRIKGLLIMALFNSNVLFCKVNPNHPLEIIGKSSCTSKYRVMDKYGDCVGGILAQVGDFALYLSFTNSLYSMDLSSGFPMQEVVVENNVQVYCADGSSIFCLIHDPSLQTPTSSTILKRSLCKNLIQYSCKLDHPGEEVTHLFAHRSQLVLVVYNTTMKHNAYIFLRKQRLSRTGKLESRPVQFIHAQDSDRLHVQTMKFVERRNYTLGISVYRAQVVELLAFSPTRQVLGGTFHLTDNLLHDALVVRHTQHKVWLLVATPGPIPSRLWKVL